MIVQSGLRKSMEATWGTTGLFARADVYDNTTGVPSLVGTFPMAEVVPGTYFASMVPIASRSYLAVKRVYTDNTYEELDPDYAASSEAFQCVDLSSNSGSQPVLGRIVGVVSSNRVIGVVRE